MTDAVILLVTVPTGEAGVAIARALVDEQLAACVNLVPTVRSIYRWQGTVCDDAEALALIKTTAARADAARARLLALHPYELPEVLVVRVDDGHAPYLAWLAGAVGG